MADDDVMLFRVRFFLLEIETRGVAVACLPLAAAGGLSTSQVQAPDASQLVPPVPLDGDDDNGAPSATFVDTVEALDAMISDILGDRAGGRGSGSGSGTDEEGGRAGGGGGSGSGSREACCREIAIDLEHHSFR